MGAKKEQISDRMMDRTLNDLSFNKKRSPVGYFVMLTIYILAMLMVTRAGRSHEKLAIGEVLVPYASFAGIFSSLANICAILMVVYYKKLGYVTGAILLLMQFPMMIATMFMRNSYASMPGAFSNLLTIIAISIIFISNSGIEKMQKKMQEQAITDTLTGLPNRFACSELIVRLIADGERFTFVTVDLKGFKSINETLGFKTGNEVLCEIAARWKTLADEGSSGTYDFVARLAGDEFALIIRNYASDEEVRNTVEMYERVLSEKLTVDGCDLYITASFGYAEFPTDADTADKLGSYATAAMAEVKRVNSSNRILKFTQDFVKEQHTLEMERKLRTALKNDTLFFQLQPQYDLSHKLRGFEALARMKDENGDIISPGEFIPVAEKVGLIDRVDAAVFRKSALFFGRMMQRAGLDITLSVNVSVRHLMKNDFLKEVEEIFRTSGVPASQIEIEITESIMIDSAEKALDCIEGIRSLGVKIAIDDFGTGYSSLSYLNRFPAHLLKIDKSFIDAMNTNESSKQYVASIISIGHILGFDVISEGVEEDAQIDTLRSIGCDFVQGYVWGRPLSQDQAEAIVMQAAAC